MKKHFLNNSVRALSFIEMLVVIAVFGMLTIAIVDSILYFYKANTSSIEQEYQVENARRGIEVLVQDIREATYADNGSYPLASIASSSITFYSDTDGDNSVEKIRYQLSNLKLLRNVVDSSGTPPAYTGQGATTTVSNFIRNSTEAIPVFRYYNASNVEVTDPALIATVVSVTVTLVVDITQNHTPGQFTLKGSATLRNLRAQ